MMKAYDSIYVHSLEDKIRDLENELRTWRINAVYLDMDDKYAVWAREADELLAEMDDDERREQERLDNALAELGL